MLEAYYVNETKTYYVIYRGVMTKYKSYTLAKEAIDNASESYIMDDNETKQAIGA